MLTGIDREARERVPHLILNEADNEYFRSIITMELEFGERTLDSHERLWSAYEIALERVRAMAAASSREAGDRLNDWLGFLSDDAQVVLFEAADGANAYKMFETLNDRGLRTSQADLIKNYLFSRSQARLDEVQGAWSEMIGVISNLDQDDALLTFIRHALIVTSGHLTAKEVYDKVQEKVKNRTSAVQVSKSLRTIANSYVAVWTEDPDLIRSLPPDAPEALRALNLFDVKPMRPLVVATCMKLSGKELSKALTFLAALTVRLVVAANTRSGSVEQPLADLSNAIWSGDVSTASEIRKRLAIVTPGDTQFEEAFRLLKVSKAQLARYYLRSLQAEADGSSRSWYVVPDDPGKIDLEHVIPKRPLEESWGGLDQETVKQYRTRLGNQALMPARDNSELGNAEFDVKTLEYKTAEFSLTAEIAGYEQWGPAEVKDRQEKLAKLAVTTWSLKLG